MASGLIALLDDVAGLTKLTAASLDDVVAATGKVSLKAAGVVIDDTAVTPGYVIGLAPERELPIIAKIALGSLRNKLLILLPAALALSAFAPWAITPLLVLGGLYLCFEGAEKVVEAVWPHHAEHSAAAGPTDPVRLEAEKVSSAVRTDLILSAEIMAIALNDVADRPLLSQAVVLGLVGIAITAGVYGVVALIVKADDVGVALARRQSGIARLVGRALVKGMPVVMRALGVIGTAAMMWVGGGIVLHGAEMAGWHAGPDALHHAADTAAAFGGPLSGVVNWLVTAAGSGVVGLVLGIAIVGAVTLLRRMKG